MGHGVDRNETADGSGAAVTPVTAVMFTAKGDLAAGTANAAVDNLAVGANETRLVADSTQATGLKYVADTTNYAVGAKGDLLVGTAADTVAALTVGANNTILVADSAQATGAKWAVLAASDTIPGLIEIATQAEQETGTDTTRAVSPGRQHYHPSAAKAWVQYASDGTLTASYNVASVTDNGTGNLSPVWSTDFSSVNYSMVCSPESAHSATNATSFAAQAIPANRAATGHNIITYRQSDFAQTDITYVNVAAFGDQ